MTKRILVGLGALAILIAAGAAWAHGPGKGLMMKQMITRHVAQLEDLIKATPQQRTQIEQSRDTILNALQARGQNRGQDHQQLMQMLTADKVNPDDLYAIANKHAQAIQDLAKVIVPEIVKVHDVLTPAQRQTLAQHAQEMRQKHQEHRQNQQNQGGFGGPGE
jgi:Spy/CpxP family protein refolding chaperone